VCKFKIFYLILERPCVVRHPVNITAEISSNVNFSVQAAGYGSFVYQWYHNNSIINGSMTNENSSYLYINNIKMNDQGSYYCKFCNHEGYCVSSYIAELIITGTCIAKYVNLWFVISLPI